MRITEKDLLVLGFNRVGIHDTVSRFCWVGWLCGLESNVEAEWARDGIILTSECGTVRVRELEDLKEFIKFEKFLGDRGIKVT